jgi:hypothetical protein
MFPAVIGLHDFPSVRFRVTKQRLETIVVRMPDGVAALVAAHFWPKRGILDHLGFTFWVDLGAFGLVELKPWSMRRRTAEDRLPA